MNRGGPRTEDGHALAPGRRFRLFFTAVCIDISQRHSVRPERIGYLAGVTSESVRRFEKGETFPTENLDAYAAAYAKIDGLSDGRDIFDRAMDWWRIGGKRPLTAEDEPETLEPTVLDVIESIHAAAARDAASRRPTSTRKRRAAGE